MIYGLRDFDDKLSGCSNLSTIGVVDEVKKAGFTAVVSFLTDDELEPMEVSEDEYRSLFESNGIKYKRIPIPDGSGPRDSQIGEFLKFVNDEQTKGGRVLIHCMIGHGRTGLMGGMYLVSKQIGMEKVIGKIGSLETQDQYDVLSSFAAKLGRSQMIAGIERRIPDLEQSRKTKINRQ